MVCLYGNYDSRLSQLEHAFPLPFPWNDDTRQDVPRFFRDADGWWRDPTAYPTGKALVQCVGDLICEPKVGRAYRYGDSYFFHPAFQFVRPLLAQGDLNLGNLETTVSDMTPYADVYHSVAGDYHCNVHPAFLDALRYAGFDGVACANNHNLDSAASGIVETNQRLDAMGFARTGLFGPDDTDRAMLMEVNGIRIGVLAYATYFNRHDPDLTDEGRQVLINAFSPEKAMADVAWAKARGAEFIISYIHWGKSYVHYPTDIQKEQAQALADAGVDFIAGAHSHCLQINDTVTAKDGRAVPVIYSQGNFITNEGQDLCRHCGVTQLRLTKEETGITCDVTFQPCMVMTEFGTGRFCNVPADPALNGGFDDPELHRSEEFAKQYISYPLPASGRMTVAEACALWGVPTPEGLEYAAFDSISPLADITCDRMLYFANGSETKFQMLQLRRRDGILIVTEQPWEERYRSIVVPDVKRAYETLSRHIRDRFDAQCVMVMGSHGKTAARFLITEVLRQKYPTLTHADGVQIDTDTYRRLHPHHQWFVQEVRPNTPFGYGMQARILKPAITVVTSPCEGLEEAFEAMESGLVLLDDSIASQLEGFAKAYPQLRFALSGKAEAPGLLMNAGAALAIAKELDIPNPILPEYTGLERSVRDFKDIHLVLHTACPDAESAKAALEKAKTLGPVVAICDTRFVDAMEGADTVLTTQPYEDREQRHAAEHALERQALAAIRPGCAVLLCGMRDCTLNTTLRRLFGFTDGIITDLW